MKRKKTEQVKEEEMQNFPLSENATHSKSNDIQKSWQYAS